MITSLRLLNVILLSVSALLPAEASVLPAKSTQCLVGITDSWDSSSGTLQLYQKSGSTWKPDGAPVRARLGKNGLAWGLGIHPTPRGAVTKKEGDWRSPAGIFSIGGAWGYQTAIQKHPKLPYRKVTPRDLWVEDPASLQYNQNVILDHAPSTPWEKKQQMKQNDHAHSLKLFIAHNAPPKAIPHAGSSIFFHIWRGGGSRPTAGCTAMEESKLRALIARLDPTRRPCYILLPKAEYQKYRKSWKLP